MASTKRTSLKEIRKDEIMQAALEVLSEKGSTNLTLDDIAKASGFSKGGITYYYSSKEDLIKDVFEYFFEGIYKKAFEEMSKHTDPLDKLLSYGWLYDRNDHQTTTMWTLTFDVMALATHKEDYRKSFQVWIGKWVNIVSDILQEGNSTGQFQIEDIEGMAQLISATSQGIASRWHLDRENHSSEWATKYFTYAVTSFLNVRVDQAPQQRP